MPIDPSILLKASSEPTPLMSPAENAKIVADQEATQLALENDRLTVAGNRLKMSALEDARREEAVVRRVAMESGGDWEEITKRLRVVAPGAALKYEEQLAKTRKEAVEAQAKALANEQLSIQKALGILRSIGDDATYQQMLPTLRGMNADLAQMLPAQFDPERVQQLQQFGLTAEKALDLSRQSLQMIADGKLTDGVASALSMADTEQEWNETLHDLHQAGVPKAFLRLFGQWTTNEDPRERVLKMALTPEKRAELDQWTKTFTESQRRFNETMSETKRHNQATESVSQGQLRVAQRNAATAEGNLQVRRQEMQGGGAAGSGTDAGTMALAEQIIAHPERFKNLDVGLATRDALTKEFARRGLPVPEVVKFTAGQQKDLQLVRGMRRAAQDLLAVGKGKNWSGTGFIAGPMATKADDWGLLSNQDAVAVRSAVAKLAVAYRKATSGLSVTGYEIGALAPLLPDVNNSPASIQQKARALLDELEVAEGFIIDVAEKGPRASQAPAGAPPPAAAPSAPRGGNPFRR